MKEYLFYFTNGVGSVFDSQVLSLLHELSKKNVFKKVFLFIGIQNRKDIENLKQKEISPYLEVIQFRSRPNYPFFNKQIQNELKKAVSDLKIDFKKAVFHTRGELLAFHLQKALPEIKTNLIADIRGASIAEVNLYFRQNRILKLLKVYNYKKALSSLKNIAKVVAVSDSLKKYLVEHFHIPDEKITVIPCLGGKNFLFSEKLRKEKRKELQIGEDDIVFVFSSGGEANWQNYELIYRIANMGLKVINLSKKIINLTNVINRFVDYVEVPAYLNAADIALIWRDINLVNKVASPVKFSEYIMCGLPVIANESVNLVSKIIKDQNIGKIFKSDKELNKFIIKGLIKYNRFDISKKGKNLFSVEKIVSEYMKAYFVIK